MASINLNPNQSTPGVSSQNTPPLTQDELLKKSVLSRRGENSFNDTKDFLNEHCVEIKLAISQTADDLLISERICPITQQNIKRPIRLACNHIFEQYAIKSWVRLGNNCPYRCDEEISESDTDVLDQETLDEIKSAATDRIDEIGKRIGVNSLRINELDRIHLELGGLSDGVCQGIDNFGYYQHWFKVSGTVDTLINLSLIFPKNNIGSDPFSSILKTTSLQFLPFTAGSSILTMALIRHYGERHLANQSDELNTIYNSLVNLETQYWTTNLNISNLSDEFDRLSSNFDQNTVRINAIENEINQLQTTLSQLLIDQDQLRQLPEYSSMLDKLNQYSYFGAISTFIGISGLQAITNKFGQYIDKNNEEITVTLKDASSEILDICNSEESESNNRRKFKSIVSKLDNMYESINFGWTGPLKLNYFMLSSFIHLVLGNFNKAINLTNEGLQTSGLYNNSILLYNKTIAYLAKGNKTGLYETLNQLKNSNLLDIAVRIESYLDIKDEIEVNS